MSEDLFVVNWELLFDGIVVDECYEIFFGCNLLMHCQICPFEKASICE